MTVDGSANVVGYDDYYPFGMVMEGRSYTSTADPRFKYTSKERDTESGLDCFGARYYDARVGKWLSLDPMADKFIPWSPYAYSFCNPLRFVDPSGMEGEDGIIKGVWSSIVTEIFGGRTDQESHEIAQTSSGEIVTDGISKLNQNIDQTLDATKQNFENSPLVIGITAGVTSGFDVGDGAAQGRVNVSGQVATNGEYSCSAEARLVAGDNTMLGLKVNSNGNGTSTTGDFSRSITGQESKGLDVTIPIVGVRIQMSETKDFRQLTVSGSQDLGKGGVLKGSYGISIQLKKNIHWKK